VNLRHKLPTYLRPRSPHGAVQHKKQGNPAQQTLPPRDSNEYKAVRRPVTTANVNYALLCENMTSSTKPEVHNVLHCRQRIKGFAGAPSHGYRQHTKILGSLDIVFELCKQTGRHTDILTACTLPEVKWNQFISEMFLPSQFFGLIVTKLHPTQQMH